MVVDGPVLWWCMVVADGRGQERGGGGLWSGFVVVDCGGWSGFVVVVDSRGQERGRGPDPRFGPNYSPLLILLPPSW